MKKKILYIADYDPHIPYSGIGIRGTMFVNFLAKHYDIDLIYLAGCGHAPDPEVESKFLDKLPGVRQKVRIPFSQVGYFLYSKAMHNAASELLKKESYDYILADYGLSARYGYVLSRQFKVPFIYNSGNVEFRQYRGKVKTDIRRLPLVPYVWWVERKGCKKADILVACSEADADYYGRWVKREQIIVVPQGFDETDFNPHYKAVKNDPKIILFFGNFNIVTNRQAVQAVHEHIVDEVVKEYPNIKFQFIGANPPVKEWAHPNFEYLGFVPSLSEKVKAADVMISPMIKGWGMPTKVVESMACGKRVIATEVGARAVPEHYSRLTKCEVKDFAKEIVKVLKEDNPVDGEDFEQLKKDFSWNYRLEALRRRIDAS